MPTFLFADLCGFTSLTDLRGDEYAADLACAFAAEVKLRAAEHDVQVVKGLGDGVMLHAVDAAQALALARRLVAEIGALPSFPAVRLGLHSGPAVKRGDDWFGATVNVAARIADHAGADEVLLSGTTATEARATGLRSRGRWQPRGVVAELELLADRPSYATAAAAAAA